MNFRFSFSSPRTHRGFGLVTAACMLLTASPAFALPLISELFYDAVGSDDGKVFVEISGAPGASLDGFRLEGINGGDGKVTQTVALSGTIGADGLFLVADATSNGGSQVVGADLLANFDFQNGPDSVTLVDPLGSVVDGLGYGTFGPGLFFAGRGTPAADAPAGSSLARLNAWADSADNGIDFQVLSSPTPGMAPGTVPEPSTAGLLAAGLLALRCRGRAAL